MALQSQKRRRRRRSNGGQEQVSRQVRVAGQQEFRLRPAETLASIGVLVMAVALIGLVWISESRSITSEQGEIHARAVATVSAQAFILADEVRREILGADQALRVLKEAAQADPIKFDMHAWQQQLPMLTEVTDDVFIADEQMIIRNDTNPTSVGLGVGARIAGVLGSAVPENKDASMLIGPTLEAPTTRQHVAFLLVPLDHPGGWRVGAIFRTNLLSRLYSEASLGKFGMTALINTRLGRVQAVAGPAAAYPAYDIANSAMYAAMQNRPDGIWDGVSGPDNVRRIHAFRRVPGRDLIVVVAVGEAEAMEPATAWAGAAQSLAWVATLLILGAAALIIVFVWTFRLAHRQRTALDRERAAVAQTQSNLTDVRSLLDARTGQLQTLVRSVDEGVAVFDPELRLTEWNAGFPALFGIAPEQLQPGLSLDEMLRSQALAGAFGPLDDPEAEAARRVAQLRTAGGEGAMLYIGPHGRALAVRATGFADSSMVLVVTEATGNERLPAAVDHATPPDDDPASAAEPLPASGPVDTR
jgi:PAS domain-containing protein